jgi:hypothetical protein
MVIAEYNGAINRLPNVAPQREVVELQTSIRAFHNGPLQLATNLAATPPMTQETANAVGVAGLASFAGGFVLGGPFGFLMGVAGVVAGLSAATTTPQGRLEQANEYDRFRERGHLVARLRQLQNQIDLEVLTVEGQPTVSKTYKFGTGRLAYDWIYSGPIYWKNPLNVMLKDPDGNILEIASLPRLNIDHRPTPDSIPTW